jgi:hypothetical protein
VIIKSIGESRHHESGAKFLCVWTLNERLDYSIVLYYSNYHTIM